MLKRFWRSEFGQRVIPFVTSLGVHAGILLFGVLMFRSLVVLKGRPEEVQAVTPDTQVVAADLPAGISDVFLGAGERPHDVARQDVDPDAAVDAPGFADRDEAAFDLAAAADAPGDRDPAPSLIGNGDVKNLTAVDAVGATGGPGGRRSLAPFGAPGGGVPTGSIFAAKEVVRSVAFVCDASGSMIDKFEPLREQLSRQVGALTPVQSFNVIFFQDDGAALALSKAELVYGVTGHKRRAEQFLRDVTPAGATNPLPSLALALRQKPELIWLLTDGDFPDNNAVLDLLRRQNPGGRVRINTIAFVERGEQYERVLRTIAAENRGTFRYVAAADVD